jgi:hypothetical protein
MQFALDDLSTTCSNINLSTNSSSQLSGSSSFSLNYVKIQNNIQNQNGNISSQYADLNKLYCVVSTLLRCYDLSAYCTSYQVTINIFFFRFFQFLINFYLKRVIQQFSLIHIRIITN